MRILCSLTVILVGLAALADDKKDSGPTPIAIAPLDRKEAVAFDKDVAPILAAKCHVCHSGNLTEGKLDLGTHASLMKGGKKGAVVVSGKAVESNLWLMSSHRKKPIMPPKTENNPLSPAEVALVKAWIDQGAKGPAVDVRVRPKVVLGLPPALVNPVRSVAVSPDKSLIAASRGNRIHLYDGKTGEYRRSLVDPQFKTPEGKPAAVAHLSLVESLAYSPDGKTLASGGFQEIVLWDVEKGAIKKRLTGFADRVVALAYSVDGKFLATGGGAATEDGEVKVFDADGKVALDLKGGHSDTVFGVAFNPDGKLLATAAADKFVKVFEFPSGKLTRTFEGHTHHVLDVGWTPDGKKVVSGGADNFIKVWDYEKGEKIRDIRGPQKQVTRLAFVGKTPTFLTASGDATVRLFNAESGSQNRTFGESKDFVYAVAASADGQVVAAGGEEGVVRLYNGQTGALVKAMLPPEAEPKKIEGKKEAAKEAKK